MDRYKILNIVVVVVSAAVAACVWMYWEVVCKQGGCTWELRNFTFRPLIWTNVPLAIITAALLPFPSVVFKRWLFFIASWAIPLCIIAILDIDPRAPWLFGIGRTQVSVSLGVVLLTITLAYIVGWHLHGWRKGTIRKSELARLLFLIVPIGMYWYIWQLF